MGKRALHSSEARARSESALAFGSRTDIGCIREQNEDSLIVQSPLFVVADGMGGHAAGEVASEIAVHTLAECSPAYADVEALGRAVEQANRDIINAAIAGEGREGMGTTCTAAVLDGNRLVIAQVGDSRAYLLHAGVLRQITRDHSLMANMIEAGQITPEEARVHPNRSVITRALGNDPDTVPDLYEINVEDGDRLLICSDGLTSMIEDDEVQAVMNRISDPQRCASTLVDGALAAGGLDNVTVIVVNVEGSKRKRLRGVALRTKVTVTFVLLMLAAIIALTGWGGYAYLHNVAYLIADETGMVAVYRGVPGSVMGFGYSELVETTDVPVASLPLSAREQMEEGMRVSDVDAALALVESYRSDLAAASGSSASAEPSASSASSASASSSSAGAAADDDSEDYDAQDDDSGDESDDDEPSDDVSASDDTEEAESGGSDR